MMIAIDIRSIIIFRICFGIYILYDIWCTRFGYSVFFWGHFHHRIDYHIPWYTSSSYLQSNDTPHQSYIHQIWFYRGSKYTQYLLFIITSIMAICYSLGLLDRTTTTATSTYHDKDKDDDDDDHVIKYSGTSTDTPSKIIKNRTSRISSSSVSTTTTTATTATIPQYKNNIMMMMMIIQNNADTLSMIYKILFYILVSSYQHRNMYVHDGSDTYTRLLLLYSCFIPLQYNIINNNKNNNYSNKKNNDKSKHHIYISSISITSISIQIICMYLGTVCHRTIDFLMVSSSSFVSFVNNNEWLPPSLSAVYHAICINTFATRYNSITNGMICGSTYYTITQCMTLIAMIIETVCPIIGISTLILLRRTMIYDHPYTRSTIDNTSTNTTTTNNIHNNTTRYVFFVSSILWYGSIVPLFVLHLGLLCCLRLPNWQCIAMIALLLWIPGHIWDIILVPLSSFYHHHPYRWNMMTSFYHRLCTNHHTFDTVAHHKKTDSNTISNMDHNSIPHVSALQNVPTTSYYYYISIQHSSKWIRYIEYCLLWYMIYNFSTERHMIPKYDHGDIGEFFRISQYWVMYSTVGTITHTSSITGTLSCSDHTIIPNDHTNTNTTKSPIQTFDILQYISTGKLKQPNPNIWKEQYNISDFRNIISQHQHYPTVRWERAIYTWAKDSYEYRYNNKNMKKMSTHEQRIRYFSTTLCQLLNDELSLLQLDSSSKRKNVIWGRQSFKQQRIQTFHQWFVSMNNKTDTNHANSIPMNTDSAHHQQLHHETNTKKLYVKDVEVRFQHFQGYQQQQLIQKITPDTVITVSC